MILDTADITMAQVAFENDYEDVKDFLSNKDIVLIAKEELVESHIRSHLYKTLITFKDGSIIDLYEERDQSWSSEYYIELDGEQKSLHV